MKSITTLAFTILALALVPSCKKKAPESLNDTAAAFLDELKTFEVVTAESWSLPRELLKEQKFDELETLGMRYQLRQHEPKEGLDNITRYFEALSDTTSEATDNTAEEKEILFQKWREQDPESVIAAIAQAGFLSDYAWDARGDGYASEVSEEQFRVFHQRLIQAAEILLSVPEEGRRKFPFLHGRLLTCARGLGRPEAEFDAIYAQGVAEAPMYVETHLSAAHFNMPQWGGKPGEWEANLTAALKGMKPIDASRVYAETIYRLRRRGHFNERTRHLVIDPANINVNRIILGLGEILRLDPGNIYFNNALAHANMSFVSDPFACRNALLAAGGMVDPRIWDSREHFDNTCGAWLRENLSKVEEY